MDWESELSAGYKVFKVRQKWNLSGSRISRPFRVNLPVEKTAVGFRLTRL